MKIQYFKLHADIQKKLNTLKLNHRDGSKQIGVSRSTFYRLSKEKPMLLDTYLKLTDWLQKDLEYYIVRSKHPAYIQKRIDKNKSLSDRYVLHEWKRP